MKAVEFTAELGPEPVLKIPQEAAARLPKTGRARIIVVPSNEAGEQWREAAYEQFMRDDAPEDAIYDSYR